MFEFANNLRSLTIIFNNNVCFVIVFPLVLQLISFDPFEGDKWTFKLYHGDNLSSVTSSCKSRTKYNWNSQKKMADCQSLSAIHMCISQYSRRRVFIASIDVISIVFIALIAL